MVFSTPNCQHVNIHFHRLSKWLGTPIYVQSSTAAAVQSTTVNMKIFIRCFTTFCSAEVLWWLAPTAESFNDRKYQHQPHKFIYIVTRWMKDLTCINHWKQNIDKSTKEIIWCQVADCTSGIQIIIQNSYIKNLYKQNYKNDM